HEDEALLALREVKAVDLVGLGDVDGDDDAHAVVGEALEHLHHVQHPERAGQAPELGSESLAGRWDGGGGGCGLRHLTSSRGSSGRVPSLRHARGGFCAPATAGAPPAPRGRRASVTMADAASSVRNGAIWSAKRAETMIHA